MMQKKVNARALANVYRALLVLLVGKALALEPTSTYEGASRNTSRPVKIGLRTGGKRLSACLQNYLNPSTTREWEATGTSSPANPDQVVAVWAAGQQNQDGEGGPILANSSSDGGVTWNIPTATGIGDCSSSEAALSDPVHYGIDEGVSIGSDGKIYVGALLYSTDDRGRSFSHLAIPVVVSADQGRSWSAPTEAVHDIVPPGGKASLLLDNVDIAADNQTADLVFLATTFYEQELTPMQAKDRASSRPAQLRRGSPAVTVSKDGGRTWSDLTEIAHAHLGERTSSPRMIARHGHVSVYYYIETAQSTRIEQVSSSDAGRSWSTPRVLVELIRRHRSVGDIATSVKVGSRRLPVADDIISVASDQAGNLVYLAFSEARPGIPELLNTFLMHSTDGGQHWSVPMDMNSQSNVNSFLPLVSIDSSSNALLTLLETPVVAPKSSVPATLRAFWISSQRPSSASARAVDAFGLAGIANTGDYHGLVPVQSGFVQIYGRTACPPQANSCQSTDGFSVEVTSLRIPSRP